MVMEMKLILSTAVGLQLFTATCKVILYKCKTSSGSRLAGGGGRLPRC